MTKRLLFELVDSHGISILLPAGRTPDRVFVLLLLPQPNKNA
jgi:hypothetical protein